MNDMLYCTCCMIDPNAPKKAKVEGFTFRFPRFFRDDGSYARDLYELRGIRIIFEIGGYVYLHVHCIAFSLYSIQDSSYSSLVD